MVQEKVEAGAEAMATIAGGGSIEAVLAGYRRRVAFNAQRLSPGWRNNSLFCDRRSQSSRERRPMCERCQAMIISGEDRQGIGTVRPGNVQGEAWDE